MHETFNLAELGSIPRRCTYIRIEMNETYVDYVKRRCKEMMDKSLAGTNKRHTKRFPVSDVGRVKIMTFIRKEANRKYKIDIVVK